MGQELVYLIIGGGEWAMHHGFYECLAAFRAKLPTLSERMPMVLQVHPGTKIGKDWSINYPNGTRVFLVGNIDHHGHLLLCN